MRIISVRQPWAWLILHAGKDVENRPWWTKHRGELLIQAASRNDAMKRDLADIRERFPHIVLPDRFEAGGIIGIVELRDVVTAHPSPWFRGPYGWLLDNPRALPFAQWRGAQCLQFAPDELVERVREQIARPA